MLRPLNRPWSRYAPGPEPVATRWALLRDMAAPEGVQHFVDETVARFGGIDIMVNSAGGSNHAPFMELPGRGFA